MHTVTSDHVQVLSARDVVRRRCGADPDVWHLALVQRNEVWDQVRMRYLLDSLLENYPIGSLLVCKVSGKSHVVRVDADRTITEADADCWQLLDGQQRINALFSIFTGEGRYGRFFLHMTARREPPSGPVTTRRARDAALEYIHWQEEPESRLQVPERDRHIDLSKWYDWAEGPGRRMPRPNATSVPQTHDELLRVLNEIDPDFADLLEPHEVPIAGQRLERLLRIWREPSIPVQRLELGSPLHVLEVFTRINRAGVQVAGEDLFLAAVKTLWPATEQVLARVVEGLNPPAKAREHQTPLVGRIGALRILARLSARAVGQADLVPLTIDRLSGSRGDAVIAGMQALSDPDGQAMRRMASVLRTIAERSRLGFGLYSVDQRLWDDVLGWAAANPRVLDGGWVQPQLKAIDAYLLGATAFNYAAVLRDQFSRLAMREALASGLEGAAFPVQQIAEVARAVVPELTQGRTRIPPAGTEAHRIALADRGNASLFLSIVQQIPYEPQKSRFDWDHIFPHAKASLMCTSGPSGRRRHHKHRHLVGSAGNFWGLDSGANRAVQDLLPEEKFKLLKGWKADGTRPIWPRDRWWLTDDEIERFKDIGKKLQDREEIDSAMERFRALVTARAQRMVEEVFAILPEARVFAADSGIAGADAAPEPNIAPSLGIETVEGPASSSSTTDALTADDRIERVLRLADERASGHALRQFARRAKSLGLQLRGYQWTLTITPPSTRSLALIALTPSAQQRGLVETWVSPSQFADQFPTIPREHFDELDGIRGKLLGPEDLELLATRIERLIGAEAVSVALG